MELIKETFTKDKTISCRTGHHSENNDLPNLCPDLQGKPTKCILKKMSLGTNHELSAINPAILLLSILLYTFQTPNYIIFPSLEDKTYFSPSFTLSSPISSSPLLPFQRQRLGCQKACLVSPLTPTPKHLIIVFLTFETRFAYSLIQTHKNVHLSRAPTTSWYICQV